MLKPRGAAVLTATQPFTTDLINSNRKWFKYCGVWDKVRPCGMQTAKYKPMPRHEDICVFSKSSAPYFPIMELRDKPVSSRIYGTSDSSPVAGSIIDRTPRTYTHRNPQSIVAFVKPSGAVHPTQKPVALMEYLIRTYSNEGETVLDNAMGSGTTGVACVNTNRNFIGIEKKLEYFEIAQGRITKAEQEIAQMLPLS